MKPGNPNEIKFFVNEDLILNQTQPDKANGQAVLKISYFNTQEFDCITGEECRFSDNRKAIMMRISKAMLTFQCIF